MENREGRFILKAMCLFHKDGKVLLSRGFDKVKKENFLRVLGGSVNFYETGEAAVRREIQEELHSDIEDLELVDIMENLFVFNGERGHEIDFMYIGKLTRKELYAQNPIHIVEETYEFDAEWIPIAELIKKGDPIYPAADYEKLFSVFQS